MKFGTKNKTPWHVRVNEKLGDFMLVFAPIFFLVVGIYIMSQSLRDFWYEWSLSDRAVEVPCEIVSSGIVGSGRGGCSVKIIFEYQFGFQEFRSDVIEFAPGISWLEYSAKQQELDELRNYSTCWVDPENPSKASLKKPVSKFLWSKFAPVLIVSIFLFFAVFFFLLMLGGFDGNKNSEDDEEFEDEEFDDEAPAGTAIPSVQQEFEESGIITKIAVAVAKFLAIAYPIFFLFVFAIIFCDSFSEMWPENATFSAGTFWEVFKEHTGSLVAYFLVFVVVIVILVVGIRNYIADRRAKEQERDAAFERNRGKWEK